MRYDLDKGLEKEIVDLAVRHGIQKVILFGSRARGTSRERSDIDLAVEGGNVTDFRLDVDEKTRTLLMFDVVNLGWGIASDLQEEIERDGVVLYEKI